MRRRHAMMRKIGLIALLPVLSLALLTGCGELGRVDQGRVIAYDKEKGLVTIIADRNYADPKNPDYSILPPHVYRIPEKKSEMGPEPAVGKRMKLDMERKEIIIFDDATQDFKAIPITVIDDRKGVEAEDPLVADKKFPLIDPEKKTITIYSRRLKHYVVFSVPEEDFKRPPETWIAGDEIRIYFKEKGKALRLMNITKTDIFKK